MASSRAVSGGDPAAAAVVSLLSLSLSRRDARCRASFDTSNLRPPAVVNPPKPEAGGGARLSSSGEWPSSSPPGCALIKSPAMGRGCPSSGCFAEPASPSSAAAATSFSPFCSPPSAVRRRLRERNSRWNVVPAAAAPDGAGGFTWLRASWEGKRGGKR